MEDIINANNKNHESKDYVRFSIVYGVFQTNDSGSVIKFLGAYSSGPKANLAAKGKGAWGSDGKIERIPCVTIGKWSYWLHQPEVLTIDGDYEDVLKSAVDKAMAKLDDDDKVALGLK